MSDITSCIEYLMSTHINSIDTQIHRRIEPRWQVLVRFADNSVTVYFRGPPYRTGHISVVGYFSEPAC